MTGLDRCLPTGLMDDEKKAGAREKFKIRTTWTTYATWRCVVPEGKKPSLTIRFGISDWYDLERGVFSCNRASIGRGYRWAFRNISMKSLDCGRATDQTGDSRVRAGARQTFQMLWGENVSLLQAL